MPEFCFKIKCTKKPTTLKCNTIACGHTSQRPEMLVRQLHYDSRCHMWRADVTQALRDMRVTHRNQDLIDWSIVNEFI